MGKYEKNRSVRSWKKKKCIAIIVALLVCIILIVGLVKRLWNSEGDSALTLEPSENDTMEEITEDPGTSHLEFLIYSVEQEQDMMVVSTSYGQMRYPFAFSDLLMINPVNQMNNSSAEFCMRLNDQEYRAFEIIFNGEEGNLIGHIELEKDMPAEPVYGVFYAPDESIAEGDLSTFYAVQEIFNDIVRSLGENENFIAMD